MAGTVAACQMAVADLSVSTNCRAVEHGVAELPAKVDVACFPELALTGFVPDMRLGKTAIRTDGEIITQLTALAARVDIDLVVGFAERADGGLYNTTAYISTDGRVRCYRKRHRWGNERAIFARGTERVVFDGRLGRTALLTCYDLNFVEESAALTAEGVEVLVVSGAWPAAHSSNWRLLVRARALDGVRWVVATGRTGQRTLDDAPEATYAGGSAVVEPTGHIAAELDREEDAIVHHLDDSILEDARAWIDLGVE